MKKTQIKDALRNIDRQKTSYLSIILIALIGVLAFLSIEFTARALRKNGSQRYNELQFRDIEVVSTLLFSQEDLESIRQVEGVADAEAVWQVGAKADMDGERRDVDVISLTQRLNQTELVEGRLPTEAGECAAELRLVQSMGWKLGDRIRLESASGGTVTYLNTDEFTLTGIVKHPDHINLNVPETLYVLVPPETFDREALSGAFMKAEIRIDRAEDANRFLEDYEKAVEAVKERLEALGETLAPKRVESVQNQIREELDKGRQELDEGRDALEDARSELDAGWKALAEGEQEILDGEAELLDAEAELSEAEAQLKDGEEQLADGEKQLREAKQQLLEAKKELEKGAATLEESKAQLDEAAYELCDGWYQLENAKSRIRSAFRGAVESYLGDVGIDWAGTQEVPLGDRNATAQEFWITKHQSIPLGSSLKSGVSSLLSSGLLTDAVLLAGYVNLTGTEDGFNADLMRQTIAAAALSMAGSYEGQYKQLCDGCDEWDNGHRLYCDGLIAYDDGLARYNQGLADYNKGLARYNRGLAELEENRTLLEEGRKEYEQGLLDFEEGKKQLEEGRQELEESRARLEQGEADYAEGLARLQDGETKLLEAEVQQNGKDVCRWLIFDGKGNASFVQLGSASINMESLKGTFALLFLLVGALVIFATVSKMVDEQRNLVGTTKALGFFNREVLAKYLSFGMSATAIGMLFAILLARFVLQPFLLKSYASFFIFDYNKPLVALLPTLLVLIAGLLLSGGAVMFACGKLVRTPAVQLIQTKVPSGVKRAKGGKQTGSLYSRLILLNMRTDLKRVIVTIVSIAGCCALVVIGVTLWFSVHGSVKKQYHHITDYDESVRFDPVTAPEAAAEEIEGILSEEQADYVPLLIQTASYQVTELQGAELLCGDLEKIQNLYHLEDWKTGEILAPTDEGILIQKRAAESYGLDVGSELELTLGGTETARIRIAGIFDHYIGAPIFLSEACYQEAFGEAPMANAFLIRWNGADAAAVKERLRQVSGFERFVPSDEQRSVFDASTATINALVLMFIFIAALMAGVVQMNLTTMVVLQKKRELTIMRINGFTVKEVIGYLLWETVIVTILGILLGIGLGTAIGARIVRAMETPFLQMDRSLCWPAWIAGALLTVLFTAIVNWIALRNIKNLKLTDLT